MSDNKILAIILVVVLIVGIWFFGTRNSLVSLREEIELQEAQIETTLQRRADLIPNLVETVKGYASHEEEVFTAIADARTKLAGAIDGGNIEEVATANEEMDSALNRLIAITESYPDLEANEQFIALMDELAGTENRISVARQYYNEAVKEYNTTIKQFPTIIVANFCRYREASYFEASEVAHEVPVVDFG